VLVADTFRTETATAANQRRRIASSERFPVYGSSFLGILSCHFLGSFPTRTTVSRTKVLQFQGCIRQGISASRHGSHLDHALLVQYLLEKGTSDFLPEMHVTTLGVFQSSPADFGVCVAVHENDIVHVLSILATFHHSLGQQFGLVPAGLSIFRGIPQGLSIHFGIRIFIDMFFLSSKPNVFLFGWYSWWGRDMMMMLIVDVAAETLNAAATANTGRKVCRRGWDYNIVMFVLIQRRGGG
jgi:hypothetical protein